MLVSVSCYRTGIQRLEELSSTDKECTWRRTPGNELYGELVPVKDFVTQKPSQLPWDPHQKGREKSSSS